MKYIIDGNNLAGSLKLGKGGFDTKLLKLLRERFNKKNVVVVFDGSDDWGDRFRDGYFEIIYAGNDGRITSADDKIVEIIRKEVNLEEVTVITDDRELKERIKNLQKKTYFLSNDIFIYNFIEIYELAEKNEGEDKNLPIEKIDEINKELLDLWS